MSGHHVTFATYKKNHNKGWRKRKTTLVRQATNPEGIVRECTSTKGLPYKARLELLRGNRCAYKKTNQENSFEADALWSTSKSLIWLMQHHSRGKESKCSYTHIIGVSSKMQRVPLVR
ncbi:hypothetical protein V6Z11_D11G309400 [Gossypium hirsutum]